MGRHDLALTFRARARLWALGLSVLLSMGFASPLLAASLGKLQGKVVATDTGEPIGYADVLLVPADTTMKRVGGLTNADGTFLLEAPPGRYTLQIRAMSYTKKRIEGILLGPGQLVPFNTALAPEAIQQEEVVVEAKAIQNNETALLSARKKAATVGDAVSAEQVRKSPDKDAAEVLRRVTGLSVSDGKYVFVRGMGERYSSVEIDGVRIASPEENKRVVPLDLVPASLLENVVVQKTHTADRSGEFGGGDVQVRTKDFPGKRTWSLSVSQGFSEGVTFQDRQTYGSSRSDIYGFGSGARSLPEEIASITWDRKLARGTFRQSELAEIAKAFHGTWSPTTQRTIPNAGYSLTYGDELKLFGRPLGLIESWSFSRSFDRESRSQVFYRGGVGPGYTYAAYESDRYTESAQLGGLSALSYRFSPSHTVHMRGLYTNHADDEVLLYQGPDFNNTDALEGPLHRRANRFLYVQRNVLSGSIQGQHAFPRLLGTNVDWRFTRSRAERLQPDRREYMYSRNFYPNGDAWVEYWSLSSVGIREFGDLEDQGWGNAVNASWPYRLGAWGNGKLVAGWDRQSKQRTNEYRRFNFMVDPSLDTTLPPDSLFNYGGRTDTLGYVEETTLDIDNYDADQRVSAAYVSADVPFGKRLRGNFGVRWEDAFQEVRSRDWGTRTIASRGTLENQDWLPSMNLTWAVTDLVNVRLGASRSLSRPDLNELSPSPSLEYFLGYRVLGNPDLKRARIDNYDLRLEAFPALSEVLAVGFFYKKLYDPIERAVFGASDPLLRPYNSGSGRNRGWELEARTALRRLWRRLDGFTVNANASFIDSKIELAEGAASSINAPSHPLQGQADYLLNVALGYTTPGKTLDMALLWASTGRRLKSLGYYPVLPDTYEEPVHTLDATMNVAPFAGYRVKLSVKNLLDRDIRRRQGDYDESVERSNGRSYSIGLSYGS